MMTDERQPPVTADSDEGVRFSDWVREAWSWVVSLVVHVIVLGILASIVIASRPARVLDVQVQLATPTAGSAAEDTDDNGGVSGGAPSQETAQHRSAADASAAPLPALPASAAPGVAAPALPALTSANPALSDPAFAILAELADEAAAERTTGVGSNPLLSGTSAGFREYIGGVRGAGLDVVLVLDATESMGPSIAQAKARIQDVIGVITGVLTVDGVSPDNVRFGAIAFKDYGDDYGLEAVRGITLTNDFDAVRTFIDEIFVSGGGDIPEPIHKALAAATHRKMGWNRQHRNVILLVGDAPVHDSGRAEALDLVERFVKRQRGSVSTLDVGHDRDHVLADFGEIAIRGNGAAFRIDDDEKFWTHVVVSIFGARYEQDVVGIVARYAAQKDTDEP